MYCQNCGKQINETPCPYCGFEDKHGFSFGKSQPVETPQQPQPFVQQTAQPFQQPQQPQQAAQQPTQQPTVIVQNTNTNVNGGFVAISPKKKIVALLLCIFLGYFGIHRFYVGKIGSGVVYLFTFGLFGIGWIIDIISIIVGGFRDANGLFLS